MNKESKQLLLLLLDLYEYSTAYKVAQKLQHCPKEVLELLYILKERRELNIDPAVESGQVQNASKEAEQLSNYLLDLEVKLKKGQIIDFVRAVSPLIYRLFLRIVLEKIPNLKDYIYDAKDHRYDTWKRSTLKESDNAVLRHFKPERIVTSNSLSLLIQNIDFPKEVKEKVEQLRYLERTVRNPLAHLIKPFDEEELHRTTQFSSQTFFNLLVDLARQTGISYSTEFYFDTCNQTIRHLLDDSEKTAE